MEHNPDNHNHIENKSRKLKLSSKTKWFRVCLAASFLSPLAGIVLGLAFLTEKNFKREAVIILVFAFCWLIISLVLILWLTERNYLPQYQYLAG